MVDPVFADEEYMVYSDQTADLEEVIKQADEKKIFNKYSIEWKKIIHILFPFVDKISMGKEYFFLKMMFRIHIGRYARRTILMHIFD